MIDHRDYRDLRFFDLVPFGELPPDGSLEGASGMKARRGGYETSLVECGETAWMTPYRELSCAQVSTLVSQKMGLRWLGRPALAFATRYPLATIQYYPAEMGVFCLRAADQLAEFAQPEFGAWLAGNCSWTQQAFQWDRKLLRQVNAELRAARRLAGAQALAVRR